MLKQLEALNEASVILQKAKLELCNESTPIWQIAQHAQRHIDAEIKLLIKTEY